MIPADVALVQLVNRTASAYVTNAPLYITYREITRVTASMGRSQEINRYVAVRQPDDFAVMQDLPHGAQRMGQAFPIIPYFDPLAGFSYSWYANLKRVDITIKRYAPGMWQFPPADPGVNAVMPYISFWAPSDAPDSNGTRLHFLVAPTPSLPAGDLYPADVVVDPQTQSALAHRDSIRRRSDRDCARLSNAAGALGDNARALHRAAAFRTDELHRNVGHDVFRHDVSHRRARCAAGRHARSDRYAVISVLRSCTNAGRAACLRACPQRNR